MKFREYLTSAEEFGRIDEAAFNQKNIEKVVTLYSKIMGKRFNGIFKLIGTEKFKRKSGPGIGLRVMNNDGVMLRYNWDQKLAKDTAFDLTSMDYWDKNNTNFQKPTRTVTFGKNLNVVQVLSTISDALITGKINESEEIIKDAQLILEKRSREEKQEWLTQRNMPKSLAGSEKVMRQHAEAKGLSEELEIFLGQPETNSFESDLESVEKKFSKEVYADPETVFEDIEDLLSVVAGGKWRTLIVCGMGGVGKCLQANQEVNIKGLEF